MFKSEAQLVNRFVKYLANTGRQGWNLKCEVDTGVGLADIVLYKKEPGTAFSISVLSKISPRLAPLCDSRYGPSLTDVPSVARLLGVSVTTAQRAVGNLRNCGLLHKAGDFLSAPQVVVPPFTQVIAIEAKLRNWKGALVQAYRNRQFAHQSWVLLDHEAYSAAVSNINSFLQSGVGLATLTNDGRLYVLADAPIDEPHSRARYWQAQAALSRTADRNK